jgi:hypothetical protein
MTRVLSSYLKQSLGAADELIAPSRPSPDGQQKQFALPPQDDDPAPEDTPEAEAEPEAPPPEELAAFADPVRLLIDKAAQLIEEEEELPDPALPEAGENTAQDSAGDALAQAGEMAAEQHGGELETMVQMVDTDPEQNTKRHAGEGWYWAVVARGGESAYQAALRQRSRLRARARKQKPAY